MSNSEARQPRTIPWSVTEKDAYEALLEHCWGDKEKQHPPCSTCVTPTPGECETGAGLRRALSRATRSRSGGHEHVL